MGLLGLTSLLAGCSPYQLRGKVIAGDISYIAVVDADDPRLEGPGVSGAALRLQTDPERLNRKTIGTSVSGADGGFTIPVMEVGAGVLIYDIGLRVRHDGYIPVEQFFRMPSSSKRVLVMLQSGKAPPDTEPESPEDLLRRFKRE